MSKTIKITMWVIIAIVVVGLAWWAIGSRQSGSGQSNAGVGGPEAVTNGSSTENIIVSTGTSDSDLDQDMTNINVQMNGLSSDSASVDASVASSSQAAQ